MILMFSILCNNKDIVTLKCKNNIMNEINVCRCWFINFQLHNLVDRSFHFMDLE